MSEESNGNAREAESRRKILERLTASPTVNPAVPNAAASDAAAKTDHAKLDSLTKPSNPPLAPAPVPPVHPAAAVDVEKANEKLSFLLGAAGSANECLTVQTGVTGARGEIAASPGSAQARPLSASPTLPAGWPIFLQEAERDILLWTISFFLLGSFRIFMIWHYRSQMQAGHGWNDILQAVFRGARMDSMAAAYPVIPAFVFTLVSLFKNVSRMGRRVRTAALILALAAHFTICGITIGYFKEYHDQFNQWVVGLVTDDLHAILRTIWRGYPIVWYVAGLTAVTGVSAWAANCVLERLPRWRPLCFNVRSAAGRALLVLLCCGLLVQAFRGWGIRRPMKQRDLSVTRDPFLNKLVANPYIALHYAIYDYQYVTGAKGLSAILGNATILDAARTVFPEAGQWRDLDQLCLRRAAGSRGPRPNHIFLIVCESLDAWPMMPEYRALGLADGLLDLATNGISCQSFVSAGSATIHAVGTLVSGLPEAGVNINYQPSSRTPYPTACAPIFKRLGYHTRFIYGGYSWQRVDEFCLAQGFDEYVGTPSFKHLPPGSTGTWGAFDEYLFAHILSDIPADVPSFNIVLTTVNHPPYDCDVFARGFPLTNMPSPFDQIYDHTDPMKVFGHQWYTAKCVADFVLAAEKHFPGSVFVITGDHASRHFLNSHPPLFESRAVPCIFYGHDVLRRVKVPPAMAGCHLDLIPTLVELCADKGFQYSAIGRNILSPQPHPAGFGNHVVVTPEFLFDISYPERPAAVPGEILPNPMPSLEELTHQFSCLQAISWWRVIKGSSLEKGN